MAQAKIDRVLETVVRVDERQKALTSKVDEIHDYVKRTSERVGKLEQWKSKVTGAVSIGIPVVSIAVNWIMGKLGINNK